MGMMMAGANAKKMTNYQEPNCNVYAADGSCEICSFRFWMTEERQCVQVSDQCKSWCKENGDCTSCYLGYSLSNGECVIANGSVGEDNGVSIGGIQCEGPHCER